MAGVEPDTASSSSSRYSSRLRVYQGHQGTLEVGLHGQAQPACLCQASWQSTLLGYVASPHSPRNASQHRIRHAKLRQIRARLRIRGASLEQSVSSDATHSYPPTNRPS